MHEQSMWFQFKQCHLCQLWNDGRIYEVGEKKQHSIILYTLKTGDDYLKWRSENFESISNEWNKKRLRLDWTSIGPISDGMWTV